jgi:hypothetical protein
MSVTIFAGAFFGALVGFSTRNRSTPLCQYIFGKHCTLAKSIGLILLFVLVLIPFLSLSGVFAISETSFLWGGCLALSFIFTFFMTSSMMSDIPLES